MRSLKWLGWGLFFLVNLAVAGVTTPMWIEQGDAGDHNNPQNVTGGRYVGFTGQIGDDDIADAFRFVFITDCKSECGGFALAFEGIYAGPDTIRKLYHETSPGNLDLLTPSPGFTNDRWDSLQPGDIYVFELTTNLADPPFTFQLVNTFGLDGNECVRGCPIGAIPTATPEPSAIALMLVGLAGLASLRRRKLVTA